MNIRRLGSISMGHMALDIMANSIAVILTAVSGQFELSIGQIAFGALVVMCTSSLTQPLFGAWADRLRGRWLAQVGLLWYMLCFALVPLAFSYEILLAILMLAGFGSAAVHTAGMVIAPDAGGNAPTTATSIFFLFGQTGLALGPLISGFVLQYIGMNGLPLIALAMTPIMLAMFAYLREPVAYEQDEVPPEVEPLSAGSSSSGLATSGLATSGLASGGLSTQGSPAADTYLREPSVSAPSQPEQVAPHGSTHRAANIGAMVIGIFLLLIVLRSTTFHAYMTFLPKFLENQGYQSAAYGAMTGIFTFGGALGTFIGGWLGDRYSRRMVIFLSLVAAAPFCYLLLGSDGWLFALSAAVAGALLNMSHSIMIILGQALLPKQKGMMSGVTLGFTFASGAFVAWVAGLIADVVGLPPVMYVLAGVPIAAAVVALLLPATRQPQTIHPAPAAAGD